MDERVAGETQDEAWPVFAVDEIEAVAAVLQSGRVNQWTGTLVTEFETAFAKRCQSPHAVAVCNGSVALELALRALGIGPGDEVIVSPRSFIASASCVSLVGATPVFADVDEFSQAISVETISRHVNSRTRAIIPVHLAGWPADMLGIMELASRHGLFVIEDCAQAMGAEINGRPVGSFGHAAAFSFCQDKIITTGGEGGMVLFQDENAFRRAWSFKDHGKDFDRSRQRAPKTSFRYLHAGIGTNWRMLEMQAAIGLIQLRKLDAWLAMRTRNAGIWAGFLDRLSCLRIPEPETRYRHAYYRLYGFLEPDRLRAGVTRTEIIEALHEAGVPANAGTCPEIYREDAYAHLGLERRSVAHELGERSLAFLVHPTLSAETVRRHASRATEIIARFQRP